MVYLIALVLAAVVSTQARVFNNPVLSDKRYYHPGAIKVKDTYYVVANTLTADEGGYVFPLHTSTDLIKWKSVGYIFDSSNTPAWTNNTQFLSPKIHKIGPNFLLYFTAFNISNGHFDIGVALAPHPLGPFISTDRPMDFRWQVAYQPSIINDEGNLYLMWSVAATSIDARPLTKNGLSFSSNETTTLISATLAWEDGQFRSPWHFKRGSYHYLLYSGGSCTGIGVGRSANALGPYEKLQDPIIVPNKDYSCTAEPSVVKDLDNTSDVIVFNAISENYSILLAELRWDSDDWPYVEEF